MKHFRLGGALCALLLTATPGVAQLPQTITRPGLQGPGATTGTPASAPGALCSNVKIRTTPGLSLFAGEYGTMEVVAPEGIDAHLFGPIERLSVPSTVGAVFSSKGRDHHGNTRYGGVGPKLFLKRYAQAQARYTESEAGLWCTNAQRGNLWLRASFLYDLRYKWIVNFDHPLGHHEYRGAKTTANWLPGWGFPVHRVQVLDVAKAREKADEMYQEFKEEAGTFFYSYELVLWGRVTRKESWGKIKDDLGGSRNGAKVGYDLTLEGQIRRRIYNDPRIGMANPKEEAGSSEFIANVVFRGKGLHSDQESEMKRFRKMVTDFCGNAWGCGAPPPGVAFDPVPGDPAGFVRHVGGDEEDRMAEMCKKHNKGKDCFGAENPFLDLSGTKLTEKDVQELEGSRGSGPAQISEEARRRLGGGVREGGDGTQIETGSQHDRRCLRLLQRDSINHYHGIREEGKAAPAPGSWRPTAGSFPENCRASLAPHLKS
jgi:hypothetical protein